jgi:hypothetical protein
MGQRQGYLSSSCGCIYIHEDAERILAKIQESLGSLSSRTSGTAYCKYVLMLTSRTDRWSNLVP